MYKEEVWDSVRGGRGEEKDKNIEFLGTTNTINQIVQFFKIFNTFVLSNFFETNIKTLPTKFALSSFIQSDTAIDAAVAATACDTAVVRSDRMPSSQKSSFLYFYILLLKQLLTNSSFFFFF